jgi:tRNA pseudouridine38-40 synthase
VIKYLLHIAYDGSNYRGWQRQSNVLGVQQVLEESLSRVLGEETTVLGCGRTDAQVHASQYFAQFTFNGDLRDDFDFVLNRVLPDDIKLYDTIEVLPVFNVQHQALWRTYKYYLNRNYNPFTSKYCAHYKLRSFDFDEVERALRLLTIYNDFHSFCKTPDRHAHTIVQMEKASLDYNAKKDIIRFEFKANRFLKGMVRALVYDLLQIAESRLSLADFEKKLNLPGFYANIQLAHPQGLYLTKIEYEKINIRNREEPIAFLM